MALYVNTNVSALNGQKNLANVTNRLNASFEKLSSGSRINSAKDDAAGLQISDRLTTQVIGLTQATRNANDGISIAQIAEGALQEVTNNVQRMRQLTVQGGNTVMSQDDRNALSQEFEKLLNVNEDIANRTAFGEQKLLDGTAPTTGFRIQSGAYSGEVDTITTGNATFKGLLGQASRGVDGESVNGVTSATLQVLSAINSGNVSLYGPVGALAEAYAALTTVASILSAASILYGTAIEGNVTLSNFAQNTDVSFDMEKISDVLRLNVGDVQTAAIFTNDLLAAFSASGITTVTAGASAGGFSADQSGLLRQFATDKLLAVLSDVVGEVGSIRATLGAEQNGLASVIRSNTTGIVNVSDAKSRIKDTDFAAETAELTRNQIIQQASNSILSQANQLPQAALSLLGG